MVRRRWDAAWLERLTPAEFQFFLENAAEAAKEEAEAMKRAGKG